MLGLADRSKTILLLKEVFDGNDNGALNLLKELIVDGIDAKNFLNDVLEVLYLFSRRVNLGSIEKDMTVSEEETKLVDQLAKNIEMQDLGLFWQLTLKTINDLNILGNENLALEMFIMQLTHLKKIGHDKNLVKDEKGNNEVAQNNFVSKENKSNDVESKSIQIKDQLKNTDQLKSNPVKNLTSKSLKAKSGINNFQDLIDRANEEKEVELRYDLERNVKLVSFKKGKIDISFNEKLNKNFIKLLTEKLLLWTGERWLISLSKNNDAKSIYEKNLENKSSELKEFSKSEIAQQIQAAFPDSKLLDITEENND